MYFRQGWGCVAEKQRKNGMYIGWGYMNLRECNWKMRIDENLGQTTEPKFYWKKRIDSLPAQSTEAEKVRKNRIDDLDAHCMFC